MDERDKKICIEAEVLTVELQLVRDHPRVTTGKSSSELKKKKERKETSKGKVQLLKFGASVNQGLRSEGKWSEVKEFSATGCQITSSRVHQGGNNTTSRSLFKRIGALSELLTS